MVVDVEDDVEDDVEVVTVVVGAGVAVAGEGVLAIDAVVALVTLVAGPTSIDDVVVWSTRSEIEAFIETTSAETSKGYSSSSTSAAREAYVESGAVDPGVIVSSVVESGAGHSGATSRATDSTRSDPAPVPGASLIRTR